MQYFDYPQNEPQHLLDYLRKLVNKDETAYKNALEFKDHWVQKLIEHLQNKLPSTTTNTAS